MIFFEVSKYSSQKNISIVGHHETGGQIQNYENQQRSFQTLPNDGS